jgi:DNA-binding NarL/FixJ family response regulator
MTLNEERGATVLVAVGAPQVREALSAIIGSAEGFAVVGEASTEEEALQLARDLRPSVALVDEELPGCCGSWTVQTMQQNGLVNAIVAMGLRANGQVRAETAGAHAYVQTGAPADDVLAALRRAHASSALSGDSAPATPLA